MPRRSPKRCARRRTTREAALAALMLLGMVGGCASTLTGFIVESPNHGKAADELSPPGPIARAVFGIDESFRVDVHNPPASLEVWVVEPDIDTAPRGTVLVLHGFLGNPSHMIGKAHDLADADYRAVLVAMRGNGGSTGDYNTFGVVEKRDLSQVIDALEARGLVAGRLGVWGFSYGSALAIELAGYDPRIDAVVAVSGFSSMRGVTPQYISTLLPMATWVMDDTQMQAMIDDAGRRAGFDPDYASAATAIARTDAPVLIMHGTWDALVPVEHAHRLAAAANDDSRLVLLPGRGHVLAWMDLDGRAREQGVAWFDQWLAESRAVEQ